MKHFTPSRWKSFKVGLRRHWPNLTDHEIEQTGGDYAALEALIEEKNNGDSKNIRETLAMLFDAVSEGHPEIIDDYTGIERAQNEGPTPNSNEWMAREEQNRPDLGY